MTPRAARLFLRVVAALATGLGLLQFQLRSRAEGRPRAPYADAGRAELQSAGVADGGKPSDSGIQEDAGIATSPTLTMPAHAPRETVSVGTCIEHVPEGANLPSVTEEFPTRGTSGYATSLRLVIQHGKGETVLPEGFKLQASSEAAKALHEAGFVIPDAEGAAKAEVSVVPLEAATRTTVLIPFVPLPPKPGRNAMVLPPLPIAVARANNEYLTLCTKPHAILVEDPIANELNPKVRPNPPPMPQRVDWPLARMVAVGIPLGLLAGLFGALTYAWWSKRPKVVPEPPRIPPWELAMGELGVIRQSDLAENGMTVEYVDRVSEVIRRYLGARYGFEAMAEGYNGLETTTAEMLGLLDRVRPAITELTRIRAFLEDCDLVKFARLIPHPGDCVVALERGEKIVRHTTPMMVIPVAQRAEEKAHGEMSP